MSTTNDSLLELIRSHGVKCRLNGEWIEFPYSPIKAGAWIAGEKQGPGGAYVQLNVQMDIVPVTAPARHIAGSRDHILPDWAQLGADKKQGGSLFREPPCI